MRKLLALLDGVPAKAVTKGVLKRQAWYEEVPRPSITAIVLNYNYGRYLELRLRSILDQTLPPDEIIILDDASTDYSLEIIQTVATQSAIPFIVITNPVNSGNPFVQWAKGLERANCDLVWIAEADDYCEPTLLETLAKEFVDSSVVMAWTDSIIVDSVGVAKSLNTRTTTSRNTVPSGTRISRWRAKNSLINASQCPTWCRMPARCCFGGGSGCRP
ncbi:MAG: glycosyltransferase family 2 protein [Candidatus Competibacteraceae bacterium]|nr:glycosyltransferase family 2 protein [Candidatus Competibacteraceae bacterium]